jgi:hypothetical protein
LKKIIWKKIRPPDCITLKIEIRWSQDCITHLLKTFVKEISNYKPMTIINIKLATLGPHKPRVLQFYKLVFISQEMSKMVNSYRWSVENEREGDLREIIFFCKTNLQWNLSNPTYQGTRGMCQIVQDVRILGLYFC